MATEVLTAPSRATDTSGPAGSVKTPVNRVTARAREDVAARLLASSAEHSFDPLTAIDWAAPLATDKYFMRPQRSTLFGTPTWDSLTVEQRIELTKHEVASMMHIGIWFETILMNLLTRHVYPLDPRSKHVQYAFTELADECRHSTMFGMALGKFQTPDYSPAPRLMRQGKLMLTLPSGPATWAAILLGEELIDTMQREAMHDQNIQPIMRDITRIHVIEEARHVRYAREELSRQMSRLSKSAREGERLRTAITATVIAHNFVSPKVYGGAGLDPTVAVPEAASNPYRKETLAWMATKLVEFLRSVGLIGGPTERLWVRAGLIAV